MMIAQPPPHLRHKHNLSRLLLVTGRVMRGGCRPEVPVGHVYLDGDGLVSVMCTDPVDPGEELHKFLLTVPAIWFIFAAVGLLETVRTGETVTCLSMLAQVRGGLPRAFVAEVADGKAGYWHAIRGDRTATMWLPGPVLH